jgi:hypothetical protein
MEQWLSCLLAVKTQLQFQVKNLKHSFSENLIILM